MRRRGIIRLVGEMVGLEGGEAGGRGMCVGEGKVVVVGCWSS